MTRHIAWDLGSTQVGQQAEEERAEVAGTLLGLYLGSCRKGQARHGRCTR